MCDFQIVLFKNKKRKKIIKKFKTLERANQFIDEYKIKSDKIKFDQQYNSGKKINFEIGLVQKNKKPEKNTYLKDEIGRNVKIQLNDESSSLLKIYNIKIEELIQDFQTKEKISFDQFIKKYLKGKGLKMISGLNNKIIVQEEMTFNIFILKNIQETNRFLDTLSSFFFETKKKDCILVWDVSNTQRKYLYTLLEKMGFKKRFLYRKFTARVPLK